MLVQRKLSSNYFILYIMKLIFKFEISLSIKEEIIFIRLFANYKKYSL
jgi:hypothetical protein